jgi:hypothetical protein
VAPSNGAAAESQRLCRDLLLEEVEALSRQAERIELHLNQRAKHSLAVLQLLSIPGVGIRTAEAVAAFIDDPDRFRAAKAVGRYFGLVKSQDQSGDRNRLGQITREGPAVVRQLVAEPTWPALRRSPTVRAYFERVQRDDPQRKKVAQVATAHYLVRVMLALLKRGTSLEEAIAPADEPKRASQRRMISICDHTISCQYFRIRTGPAASQARPDRASGPEEGGDPRTPARLRKSPQGHRVGMSPASCRQAGALIAAPCTPG